MAGSAESADAATPLPLLTLLDDASRQGRPALALTRRRAAEVLGIVPDDQWWADHSDAWLGVGWRAQVAADVVTFLPASGPPAESVEPVEVRIEVTWAPPAGPATRVAVGGHEVPLSDPDVLELARLAARVWAAERDGAGGGSGI